MNLEQQVCTLEQAKRLDLLLNGEESYFYWAKEPDEKWGVFCCENLPYIEEPKLNAYTSSEIGESIKSIAYMGAYAQEARSNGFLFLRGDKDWPEVPVRFRSNLICEAHARAEFLIYLLENRDDGIN